jgi:hypothetical protein
MPSGAGSSEIDPGFLAMLPLRLKRPLVALAEELNRIAEDELLDRVAAALEFKDDFGNAERIDDSHGSPVVADQARGYIGFSKSRKYWNE